MTREERHRRRMDIAEAAQVPGADVGSVAKAFGVTASFVDYCCGQHGMPWALRSKSKRRGRRAVNVFAVLKDLLAGQTMAACGVKYRVSRARIGQIADLARQAGWTELEEIAAYNNREGKRKPKRHGRPT